MTGKELTLVLRVVKSVRFGGLWLGTEGDKVHILAKFSIFSFLSISVLQLIALVIAKDDPDRMFECFSVISFCGMGILKLFSLHRKRNDWLRLLNRLAGLENDQRFCVAASDQLNEENQLLNCIEVYTAKFKRTSLILHRIYGFTAVIFILSPFIEYGLVWFFGTKPEAYPHILPGWNPLDEKHVGFYMVMVFVEAVAAIFCVFVHVAFDTASISVMIFVCGQFSSLKLQCSKIGGRGKFYTLSEQRDARAHLRIIKCHQTHILLVKSVKGLDKLLCDILGLYFFLATLTLCTVAIRVTSEQMSVMQLLSLLQYMCGILTQLFLFCSYGDAVYNESSVGPCEGPFCAAIWCLSPKIRREIAILGFGMMLPRKLHAGPFNTLDLPTFIQIVRTAYSYYAVLGKSKAT